MNNNRSLEIENTATRGALAGTLTGTVLIYNQQKTCSGCRNDLSKRGPKYMRAGEIVVSDLYNNKVS